jgi:hypothetical protein
MKRYFSTASVRYTIERKGSFRGHSRLMKSPAVLLFTDADVFAGTERHMAELAWGLQSLGVAVRVACPSPSPLAERAAADGISVVPVPKRGLLDAGAVRTLRQVLRSGEADLIHAHNGRTAMLAALAVTAAGRGACRTTRTSRYSSASELSALIRILNKLVHI